MTMELRGAGCAGRVLGWTIGLLAGAACAQQSTFVPSSTASCLVQVDKRLQPEYPQEQLVRHDGGTVRVLLTFHDSDQAPELKWVDDEDATAEGFIDSVRSYVRGLRLPCISPGSPPVQLRQDYVFVPNDGRKVVSSEPFDPVDERRKAQMACVSHPSGAARPAYPVDAARAGEQGKVLVQLRFDASDRAPEVKILAEGKHRSFAASVREFVAGYRAPCLTQPFTERLLFDFKIEEGERRVLKDTDLPTLVRASANVPSGVYFDTSTMKCPFDVRLTYMRPFASNSVEELDHSEPSRGPLLKWIGQLQIRTTDAVAEQLLGEQADIHVPCMKIDL